MHLVYIDDSRDETACIFSGLAVPVAEWKTCFGAIRAFRRELRASDGIYVRKELHATDFVGGRGHISDHVIVRTIRARIFGETLRLITRLPGVRLFNSLQSAQHELWAFERLLNRINRTMLAWSSYALILCDEGKEGVFTRITRRMNVFNPIPSQFGTWRDTGQRTRNIPLDRIIEDPIFKKSNTSHFIQMADFCGYALLRKERPLASKTRYGLDRMFDTLGPILVKEASPRDPFGVIR